MRSNVRMQAHAGRVVSQLGALIEDLDNMTLVNETIYLLGENHNNRKVQAKDFEVSARRPAAAERRQGAVRVVGPVSTWPNGASSELGIVQFIMIQTTGM